MQHAHGIGHGNQGAGLARAAAQVEVFGMQAVALVEAADAFEQRARHQHQRTGNRFDGLQRLAVVRGDVKLCGRRGAFQRARQHRGEIRIVATCCTVAHALLVDQVGTEQAIPLRCGQGP